MFHLMNRILWYHLLEEDHLANYWFLGITYQYMVQIGSSTCTGFAIDHTFASPSCDDWFGFCHYRRLMGGLCHHVHIYPQSP